MGKRLVEELGMEPGVDTLGRWMAHYIAELMKLAEETSDLEERKRAQDKCCETILRLWEHRSSLPHDARPLGRLENVLSAIETIWGEKSPWSHGLSKEEMERIGGPWMGFAQEAEKSGLRMCRIALIAAIAEKTFRKEKRWLDEHGKMLSDEEKKIIEALDSWLDPKGSIITFVVKGEEKDKKSIGEMDAAERNKQILNELHKEICKISEAIKGLEQVLSSEEVMND